MVLIAIEGIDGSGKGTQARLLQERLQSSGRSAGLVSFPRYSATHFGEAIGWFLNGRFGNLQQVDPHLAATLYAADRFESLGFLNGLLAENDVVVADRYVASNMAHQGARCTGADRQAIQAWIRRMEFEVFQLPREDLVIFLELPVETAQMLIERKARRDYTDQKADLQESNREYLATVRDAYLDLAGDPAWVTIPLMKDGELQTIEEVAHDIWTVVSSRLPGRLA